MLNEGLTRWQLATETTLLGGLFLFNFQAAVKVYAIVGAVFIPMLAAALL